MAKPNFIQIVDYIFVKKEMYKTLTDDDKIDNFFIINRKFGLKYPKIAQFLNRKETDKASAMDFWFMFFRNTYSTPSWYWAKSTNTKSKTNKMSSGDKEIVMKYCNIEDDRNFEFLYEHYREDLEFELKKAKRLYKK